MRADPARNAYRGFPDARQHAAILATLGPTLASWPLVLRTLVLSVLMVVALTWLIMPALTRLFHAWLARHA